MMLNFKLHFLHIKIETMSKFLNANGIFKKDFFHYGPCGINQGIYKVVRLQAIFSNLVLI